MTATDSSHLDLSRESEKLPFAPSLQLHLDGVALTYRLREHLVMCVNDQEFSFVCSSAARNESQNTVGHTRQREGNRYHSCLRLC